jgi:hypothetical protein
VILERRRRRRSLAAFFIAHRDGEERAVVSRRRNLTRCDGRAARRSGKDVETSMLDDAKYRKQCALRVRSSCGRARRHVVGRTNRSRRYRGAGRGTQRAPRATADAEEEMPPPLREPRGSSAVEASPSGPGARPSRRPSAGVCHRSSATERRRGGRVAKKTRCPLERSPTVAISAPLAPRPKHGEGRSSNSGAVCSRRPVREDRRRGIGRYADDPARIPTKRAREATSTRGSDLSRPRDRAPRGDLGARQ